MSHFAVLVLTKENGKSLTELLAKYNQNMAVTPYITHHKNKAKEYLDNLITQVEKNLNNENYYDKTVFEDKIKKLIALKNSNDEDNIWKVVCDDMGLEQFDCNGNAISTYNLDSKWDWYSIGGRYNNRFSRYSLLGNEFPIKNVLDIAIKNEDCYTFAIVTPDGEWIEMGKMGWWGIVADKKEENKWRNIFISVLQKYNSDDVTATIVDCHI